MDCFITRGSNNILRLWNSYEPRKVVLPNGLIMFISNKFLGITLPPEWFPEVTIENSPKRVVLKLKEE